MCAFPHHAMEQICRRTFTQKIILADVNIPYKFSLDRSRDNLFFCINADEFSEQSFHSVILELNDGSTAIVPGIRNGFASAIDQTTGSVYLGGSDDTATQHLHVYKNNKVAIIPELKEHEILHFAIDADNNIIFVNTAGLYILHKAQDGIYKIGDNKKLVNTLLLENGYGLAFDKDNNIVYSNERTVNMLIPYENSRGLPYQCNAKISTI
ncbi:hypothetical protein evm_013672 [Chilo suppressalis]|nr:hypothetical protein evm_013672 [Chilo suppressalis]